METLDIIKSTIDYFRKKNNIFCCSTLKGKMEKKTLKSKIIKFYIIFYQLKLC